MTSFDRGLLRYLSHQELQRIRSVKIAMAGAGGLGSNCAHALVRCGFEKFILADHDTVDASNLNRQFFYEDQIGKSKVCMLKDNLMRINPDLQIELYEGRIGKENVKNMFGDADVIVEAFDCVESKTLIVESFMNSGKIVVAASGIAGWGHPDSIRVKQVKPLFFMVGDFVSAVSDAAPPLAPKVVMVAAKQADVVLQLVLGRWNHETCM